MAKREMGNYKAVYIEEVIFRERVIASFASSVRNSTVSTVNTTPKKTPTPKKTRKKVLKKVQPEPPAGYADDLNGYGPCIFDNGEPIGWGFRVARHLSDERFEALRKHGALECISMGQWALVVKWLTIDEAIEKYGKVTNEDRGPLGGFRSVTFGTKTFYNRRFDMRRRD
jgi:hypothetical protein